MQAHARAHGARILTRAEAQTQAFRVRVAEAQARAPDLRTPTSMPGCIPTLAAFLSVTPRNAVFGLPCQLSTV
eukprot:10939472-Alexandrium_andersonii.AAC.1